MPDAVTIASGLTRRVWASRSCRNRSEIDFEQRQVGFSVVAHDLGVGDAAVGELHTNLGGARNHMVVRDEVAVLVDDDGRAQAGIDPKRQFGAGAFLGLHDSPRVDAGDGRRASLDGVGVTRGRFGRLCPLGLQKSQRPIPA